jgi:hypothetical protein
LGLDIKNYAGLKKWDDSVLLKIGRIKKMCLKNNIYHRVTEGTENDFGRPGALGINPL